MIACLLQESGLKVREYELLRKNFSDSGNFGASLRRRAHCLLSC